MNLSFLRSVSLLKSLFGIFIVTTQFTATARTILPVERQTALLTNFPGIDFSLAQNECPAGSVDTLKHTLAGIDAMLYQIVTLSDVYHSLDIWLADNTFIQLFGKGWDISSLFRTKAHSMFHVLVNVRNFLKNGRPGRQVIIRCEDVLSWCKKNPFLGAYIHESEQIVLCPAYWSRPTLYTVNAYPTAPAYINDFITKEHILFHELTHIEHGVTNRVIEDVTSKFGQPGRRGEKVYGLEKCLKLAASKERPLATMGNADSYTWFVSMFYWRGKWLRITPTQLDPHGFAADWLDATETAKQAANDVLHDELRTVSNGER